MFKAGVNIDTTHNFVLQGDNIIVTTDGKNITSDMLRALRNSCTTGEAFSEPNLDYSCIMVGDNVDTNIIDIAMASNSGVIHPSECIRIREYFARNQNKILNEPCPVTTQTKNIKNERLLNESSDINNISNTISNFAYCDNKNIALAARAHDILLWRKKMQYCSRCGGELIDSLINSSRVCNKCKEEYFPRIEPCVIVRLTKGDEILLARHTYRNQDVYTCVAGFIEAGETAENAVRREIFEEVHLNVKNVQYIKSQSWPFPDQLMLAFQAEYDSGEIVLQKDEIADAKWFKLDSLPPTPRAGSVAYSLIHNLFT